MQWFRSFFVIEDTPCVSLSFFRQDHAPVFLIYYESGLLQKLRSLFCGVRRYTEFGGEKVDLNASCDFGLTIEHLQIFLRLFAKQQFTLCKIHGITTPIALDSLASICEKAQ